MQGLDIETYNPETGEGELDPAKGKVRLVQIRDGECGRVYDGHDRDLPAALRELDEAVAHNATFERRWIERHYGIDLEALHDTMVMSQVLYTGTNAARAKQFSHSLQAVVKRETKRELDKSEQGSKWGEKHLSEKQIFYAAMDAHILPALADTLLQRIDKFGLREVYELERRVSHAVDQMERNGFGIDLVRLDAFIAESTEQAERLKAELEEEWGINPGSSKQLREHFELDNRADWPATPAGASFEERASPEGRIFNASPCLRPLSFCSTHNTRGTNLLCWVTPQSRTGLWRGLGLHRYYATIGVGTAQRGL